MASRCAKATIESVATTREYIADMVRQLARLATAIGDDHVAQALTAVVEAPTRTPAVDRAVERC